MLHVYCICNITSHRASTVLLVKFSVRLTANVLLGNYCCVGMKFKADPELRKGSMGLS